MTVSGDNHMTLGAHGDFKVIKLGAFGHMLRVHWGVWSRAKGTLGVYGSLIKSKSHHG